MLRQWEVGRQEDRESMAAIPKLPAPQPCLQELEPPWLGWDGQPSCGEEPGHPLKSTHTHLICPHKPFSSTQLPALDSQATLPPMNHPGRLGSPFPRHIPLVATAPPPQLTKFIPHLHPEKPRASNTFPPVKGHESHSPLLTSYPLA